MTAPQPAAARPFLPVPRTTAPTDRPTARRRLVAIAEGVGLPRDARIERLIKLGCDGLGLELGVLSRVLGRTWEIVATTAPEELPLSPGLRLPLDTTVCARTISAGAPVIAGAAEVPGAFAASYGALEVASYVGVPVRVEGAVYGTLSFASTTPRDALAQPLDVELLRLIAAWVGAELTQRALEARLEESRVRLETTSGVDPVTMALNRRGIEAALEDPRRGGATQRAAVVIDLDGLAEIGTRWGRSTLDRLLAAVADAVRARLRERDQLARVGEARFVVLVDRASMAHAIIVAKRIREAIASASVPTAGHVARVGARTGVVLVDGAPTLRRVIAQAAEAGLQPAAPATQRATNDHSSSTG